jgi:hypothetical protein
MSLKTACCQIFSVEKEEPKSRNVQKGFYVSVGSIHFSSKNKPFMLMVFLVLLSSMSFSTAFMHRSSRWLQSNSLKPRLFATTSARAISPDNLPHDTLYILDGTAMMYRSYFGKESTSRYRHVMASKGGKSAHYGTLAAFAASFVRLVKDIRPKYLATAFDTGKTFRHDMFPSYKQNREKVGVVGCLFI